MRREFSKAEQVPYETAKKRALSALDRRNPMPAGRVADFIWPDHKMHGQGAGGAASRILKRMERDGLARWHSTRASWGWIKT